MIDEKYQDLLLGKNLAHFATINPDNSPQLTPVWIDYDKENNLILINSARGRKKDRNLKVNSKVAISINDSTNFSNLPIPLFYKQPPRQPRSSTP